MATAQANESPTVRESQTLSKHDVRGIVEALYNFRTQNAALAISQRNDDAESEESAILKVLRLYLYFYCWQSAKIGADAWVDVCACSNVLHYKKKTAD